LAAVATAGVVAYAAITGGAGGTAGSLVSGTSSGVGKNLMMRKVDSKKSARAGRADEAWNRLGMRTLRKAARQHAECVSHSFGEVRQFLACTRCTSLDRMLFAVGDGKDSVVVSVSWVSFRTRVQAAQLQGLIDVHATGDIAPLGGELIGAAGIRSAGTTTTRSWTGPCSLSRKPRRCRESSARTTSTRWPRSPRCCHGREPSGTGSGERREAGPVASHAVLEHSSKTLPPVPEPSPVPARHAAPIGPDELGEGV
jgi:hypothetical protein